MQIKSSTRIIIALFACMMLGCAIVSVPFVHKHTLTEQVPLQDYDASCSWIKAGKEYRSAPSQHLLACMSLLLFFFVAQPIIIRRIEDAEPARSIFTRKVQTPRAPPAC